MARRQPSPPHDDASPTDRWRTLLLAAFVALVVARTFLPEDPGGRAGHGAPLDVLWIVLATAWLLGELRHSRLRLRFGWPDALLVALVGWHTLSAVSAIRTGSPRPAVNVLCEWVAMGLVFLVVRQVLDTQRDIRAVVLVMIGLACGMSAVALHQYFVTMPADIAAYEAAKGSTETLYQQTGQWLEPGSSERARFEARLNSRLPTAGYALSNSLAGFLVPWLMMLVAVAYADPITARSVNGRRMFAAALAALAGVCIWLTGSRTAGVAVIVGLLLLAVKNAVAMQPTRIRWTAVLLGVLLIGMCGGAVLLVTSIGQQAVGAAWRSVAFRVEYWRATLAMIADYPLLGCGPGQFQDTYTAYKLVGAAEEIQDPHNWLFEVGATAGTPAVALLIALIGTVVVRAMRGDRPHDESGPASTAAPDAALFGGVAGIVLGTALAFLIGFPIARAHLVLYVAAVVSVWYLFGRWTNEGRLSPRIPLIAAIALLVNLLAAGGIGFPSVADSLWLLLAITLNLSTSATADGIRSVPATNGIRWAVSLLLALVLATTIRFEYLPVMGARLQLEMADGARAAGQMRSNRDAIEAALAADPWSATAASRLAAQRYADYRSLPTTTQIRALFEADALARRLAPRSAGTWAQGADYAAAIFRQTRRVEHREAAERCYAQALALYPTDAELHANAARFWQSVDEPARAREAAAEALRLDDATRAAGHRDRFLGDDVRNELESLAAAPP